jgi:hypothetical protein
MPSSKNYVRDYAQEYKTAKARGEGGTGHNAGAAIRHRARRKAIKLGMIKPGAKVDIDHKRPVSKGGSNSKSNLRAVSASDNRSFPRNPDGSMKSNK